MIDVLIYDDNEGRRKSLQTLLDLTEGVRCKGAFSNCVHVIEDIEATAPDVVLMDIEMPLMDGVEGVRLIKKSYPDVKIVMQTVFDDGEKIFAALKAGAEGYILKSTSAVSIIQSIKDVYEGGAFMTPSVALRVMKHFNNQDTKKEDGITLTPKEIEVLKLLTDGLNYKMVAAQLNISFHTVNSHVKKIYEKLQVHSMGEAISLALKKGIV